MVIKIGSDESPTGMILASKDEVKYYIRGVEVSMENYFVFVLDEIKAKCDSIKIELALAFVHLNQE